MIVRVNGTPLSPITTHGIDIKYDLKDVVVDAYHVVHTPVNVDLSFGGHNIVCGDMNTFNWATAATTKIVHGIGFLADSIF